MPGRFSLVLDGPSSIDVRIFCRIILALDSAFNDASAIYSVKSRLSIQIDTLLPSGSTDTRGYLDNAKEAAKKKAPEIPFNFVQAAFFSFLFTAMGISGTSVENPPIDAHSSTQVVLNNSSVTINNNYYQTPSDTQYRPIFITKKLCRSNEKLLKEAYEAGIPGFSLIVPDVGQMHVDRADMPKLIKACRELRKGKHPLPVRLKPEHL
jgi:hypothetical protein